jgi:pimeloyl-ACP methyl ester carboxylesterase
MTMIGDAAAESQHSSPHHCQQSTPQPDPLCQKHCNSDTPIVETTLNFVAPPPSALGPGTWLYGGSRALMRRVLASNPNTNVFHIGFKACNDYANGEAAMAQVQCPALFLLGEADQMTPARAARPLIAKAAHAKVVTVRAGHALMTEAPDEVLFALRDFLG